MESSSDPNTGHGIINLEKAWENSKMIGEMPMFGAAMD
jgi:hypothetical protein